MAESVLCPCNSQRGLAECCEPYLLGKAIAPTAEALMRSRYTAYCQGNIDYLITTHHPAKRSLSERTHLSKSVQNTTWLGLTVVKTEQGQSQDETGIVEFVAIYRTGNVGQLHERSRFKKQKGRWFYVDGDQLPPLEPKRNEPCWCGSGKKFKQCHGKG
ncbi:MAG: YchJ family protein [Cyanobacteria bacterium P01_F01_bin.86]